MIFVFRDLELKFGSNIAWEIGKIYGIGYEAAANIVDALGLSSNLGVSYINYYFFESFSYIIKLFFITDERLKTLRRQRMSYFLALKLRKGIRFSKGLPIRGQRTHTNGKQNRYYKKNEI